MVKTPSKLGDELTFIYPKTMQKPCIVGIEVIYVYIYICDLLHPMFFENIFLAEDILPSERSITDK